MPLVTRYGEQPLNSSTGPDQPGFGVWFVDDSDSNQLGFVSEFIAADPRMSLFYVNDGLVEARYQLSPDTRYYINQVDQDAWVVYRADGNHASEPPFVIRAGNAPHPYEGEIDFGPPNYVIDSMNLLTTGAGGSLVPVGRPLQTGFANGTARVYVAPDGDGSGIFLEVTDSDGHRIGGVIRVNDDVAGDQTAPQVAPLDERFIVGWTQQPYDGANTELYRGKTYATLESNLPLAVDREGGRFTGDVGDYVTDIFLFDANGDDLQKRERVINFGANDIFVTTTKLVDRNNDGIVGFGDNRRVELDDADGDTVCSVAIAGVTALEFDGVRQEFEGGPAYYVYSRVGSAADEHYLILGF